MKNYLLKKIWPVLLFFCTTISIHAQQGKILEGKATMFSIPDTDGTIEFVVADTSFQKKKPILLWCQGSLPVPLFCEVQEGVYHFMGGGVSNFNYQALSTSFHLVVISMPHTPVMASMQQLNQAYQYVPDNNQPRRFSEDFVHADYLENYVNRAEKVLRFLKKQSWVDHNKLIVAGHSQGTKVATKIAAKGLSVTHLGLFAANPFGRIDQYIRQARLDAQMGKISWEKADTIMQDTYEFFSKVHSQDTSIMQPEFKAWKSFNETYYDDWLQLEIPIYLAYGTEDRIADMCDIVPLFFIEKGKDNLTMKRYIGLEHNFFETGQNGRPDYSKSNWNEVMQTFIEWIK